MEETRTIEYLIADPEGNITILVLSPVDRFDYQKVAHRLLEAHPKAEQVGYICKTETGQLPHMDMCGLEFCGNASRSFAFYEAVIQDPPADQIDISVSGCDHPLHAWIESADPADGIVRLQMPIPEELEEINISITEDLAEILGVEQLDGELVHMDGISHLILRSIPAKTIDSCSHDTMKSLFLHIRDSVYQVSDRDLPAFGTMFVDTDAGRMTPIVYVRDVDTVYFEGSCASGSNAAAYALAMHDMADSDTCHYTLRQPAGTLCIDVMGQSDPVGVREMQLYGHVGLSSVQKLAIGD